LLARLVSHAAHPVTLAAGLRPAPRWCGRPLTPSICPSFRNHPPVPGPAVGHRPVAAHGSCVAAGGPRAKGPPPAGSSGERMPQAVAIVRGSGRASGRLLRPGRPDLWGSECQGCSRASVEAGWADRTSVQPAVFVFPPPPPPGPAPPPGAPTEAREHPCHSEPQRSGRPGRRGRPAARPDPRHVATAWDIRAPDDPAGGGPLVRGPPASDPRSMRVDGTVTAGRSGDRRMNAKKRRLTELAGRPHHLGAGLSPAACVTGCAACDSGRTSKSDGRVGRALGRSCEGSLRVPLTGTGDTSEPTLGE